MPDGLANRAWKALRGAGAAATGGGSVVARLGVGVRTVVRLVIRFPQGAGVSMRQAPSVLRSRQTTGVAVVPRIAGTVRPAQTEGVSMRPRMAATPGRVGAGTEIVRIKIDLTHRSGASVATNTGVDAWTNPTNAQGRSNATTATSAGEALNARTRVLELAYADLVGKTDLTIVSVTLLFYVSQAGTALGNGDLRLFRGDASTFTQLGATTTGDLSALTTPVSFDVTASYLTWASLDALRAKVEHRTDVAEALITAAVDAVELEIVATRTDLT